MSHSLFRAVCASALCVALGGCVATPSGAPMQQLEVHTILGHREVTGVGCVLSNAAGRWFVVAPGRVTVERSRSPLTIDCAAAGAGSAREAVEAHATGLIDSDRLIGNIIVRAGGQDYVRPYDGAAVAYPATLTVLMRPAAAGRTGADEAPPEPGNVVF